MFKNKEAKNIVSVKLSEFFLFIRKNSCISHFLWRLAEVGLQEPEGRIVRGSTNCDVEINGDCIKLLWNALPAAVCCPSEDKNIRFLMVKLGYNVNHVMYRD